MGVRGLTPFLTKHFPDVLKEIPTRLKAIQGKRVVIDATLLTQRFHFAGIPFNNRHVLGWYRLINDLKAHDIGVICVFDGKERNAAKMRELQRRRENRAIAVARTTLEQDRLKRLKSLQKVVTQIRKLPQENQSRVSKELKKRLAITEPVLPIPPVPSLVEEEHYVEESLHQMDIDTELDTPIEQAEKNLSSDEGLETPVELEKEVDPIAKVASKLLRRYKKYTQSLPNFANLQVLAPISLTSTSSSMITTAEKLEADPEFNASASRHQYQLAMQEGHAWAKLATGQLEFLEQAEGEFLELQERSQVLVESYKRRTQFPTDKTYEDAKILLTAMGIPCLQSEAPFEGEGLASAIVLAGLADYVVSEDTDVIVYGAPLLRGMTDKKRPLREIVGNEVQDALQLTRNAFIDFVLLLGTDFTTRIPMVGPSRALKFIKSYDSIEEIVKMETKYPPSFAVDEYLHQVASGRDIFKTLPKVPSSEKLAQTESDEKHVMDVIEGYGLSKAMLVEDENVFSVAFKGDYFGDHP